MAKRRNTRAEFFGKTYRWITVNGQLQLKPDTGLDVLFPNMSRRQYKAYLKDDHIDEKLAKLQLDHYRRLAGLTE